MKKNDNTSPFTIDQSWGIPNSIEECCPGVYYLTTKSDSTAIGKEFYAISKDYKGNIISQETMSYGIESNDVLLFEIGKDNSGSKLVDYEIQRYHFKSGHPLDPTDSLYSTALYAAEQYPEYFGGLLPPRYTPYGLTVRVKTVTNGIYFLETDHCEWLLAISFPIWEAELTDDLIRLGAFCSHDLESGNELTQYLFFPSKNFPPILYTLLDSGNYQEFGHFISSKEALMNAIWEQFPLFAIRYNLAEQLGLGPSKMLNRLLDVLGCELPFDEAQHEDDGPCPYITYHPDLSGQRYLLLPL